MVNLSSFMQFHALQTPDRVALIYGGRPLSYADFPTASGGSPPFLTKKASAPVRSLPVS